MCSEISPPRLSFSHDLSELHQPMNHHVHREEDTLLNDSNSEFEFSISSNSSSHEYESTSADELFSNGVILPIQIQKKPIIKKHNLHGQNPYTRLPPRPCPSSLEKTMKDNNNNNTQESHSRSFWGFSRSKSMNCDNTKKSLIFSSSFLPRSNSTGSVKNPNSKRTSFKDSSGKNYGASSSLYPLQKSGSGKGYGGSYYAKNGHRVSPVLNVPTPSSFFSFGSILRVGKAKKSKN